MNPLDPVWWRANGFEETTNPLKKILAQVLKSDAQQKEKEKKR